MVVLPDPDSPISASTSPFFTVKSTPFTISTTGSGATPATTRKPFTSIMFVVIARLHANARHDDASCR